MKKRGRNQELLPAREAEGNLHFRLCHLCFFLNEGNSEISECERCQHAFTDEALTQFFDDYDEEAFSDQLEQPAPPEQEEYENEKGERISSKRPVTGQVYGLSVRF